MAVRGSSAASSLWAAAYGTVSMAIWTFMASIPWLRRHVLSRCGAVIDCNVILPVPRCKATVCCRCCALS